MGFNAIPTVEELKEEYLFGVDLSNPETGDPFPEKMFERAISVGKGKVKRLLKIELDSITYIDEEHDYRGSDYQVWGFLQLFHRPVITVTSVKAIYPTGQEVITFPPEWVKLYKKPAQIHLIPTSGTLDRVLMGRGSILPDLLSSMGYVPQLFEITYDAGLSASTTTSAAYDPGVDDVILPVVSTKGFSIGDSITITESKKREDRDVINVLDNVNLTLDSVFNNSYSSGSVVKANTIPEDIIHLVCIEASIFILNTAGDLVSGPGIAAKSIGIDGLSQSISTTSSATNAGYGARIGELLKERKEMIKTLKEDYKGIPFIAS